MPDQPTRIINDWHPETRSLLERLIAAGFTITDVDCGEGEAMKFPGTITPKFLDECDCCDESWLHVVGPGGLKFSLYLVYGNSPGELVSDYTYPRGTEESSDSKLLDVVTQAHFDEWELKGQPKKRVPYPSYQGEKP